MLSDPASVVSPPVRRANEKAAGDRRVSFWMTVAVAALLVPSAGATDSQARPAGDETHHDRERRQPYRPSYLLREEPEIDQAPIFSIGIPFPQRLELWLSEKDTNETRSSPLAVSGRTVPKQVFLENGAVVLLRLTSGKITSRHKPGHQVVFEVEEDVRTSGSTCIARGTPVHGVVGPWTRASPGIGGTGRLEIHFERVPMTSNMPAALQTIRVIGRTLGESMSWVSVSWRSAIKESAGDPRVLIGAAVGIGTEAFAQLTGKLFVRGVFKIHEVKFRKGDVIRVRVWSSWLLPCDVGVTTGSRRTENVRRSPITELPSRDAGDR